MKESMTSCIRTLKAFNVSENGQRRQRTVHSQQIKSINVATNLDVEVLTDPIKSRISCFTFFERHRDNRHPADLTNVFEQLDAAGLLRQTGLTDELQCEQYLHAQIEKLIAVHALSNVTMAAFDAIKQVLHAHTCRVVIEGVQRARADTPFLYARLDFPRVPAQPPRDQRGDAHDGARGYAGAQVRHDAGVRVLV